jgi:hypothetical protein
MLQWACSQAESTELPLIIPSPTPVCALEHVKPLCGVLNPRDPETIANLALEY